MQIDFDEWEELLCSLGKNKKQSNIECTIWKVFGQ